MSPLFPSPGSAPASYTHVQSLCLHTILFVYKTVMFTISEGGQLLGNVSWYPWGLGYL